LQHLDELNMMYSGKPHFFGDAVPKEFINKFTPLKVRIRPNRVRVEG